MVHAGVAEQPGREPLGMGAVTSGPAPLRACVPQGRCSWLA
jgi:hypothetical protein